MFKQNYITILLPQFNKTIQAGPELSILEILNENHILIYAPCAGKGLCGKCKVKARGDLTPLTPEELNILTEEEIAEKVRLACKTYIKSSAELELPEVSLENHSKELIKTIAKYNTDSRVKKISVKPSLPTFENGLTAESCIRKEFPELVVPPEALKQISNLDLTKNITATLYNNELIDIENGDTRDRKYGVAIDLGTTTLACYLIDLNTGKQENIQSLQNPQSGYGADVMSRIHYCLEHENGAETLSTLIKEAINELILSVALKNNIETKNIYECVLVGNTVMNHLFFGLNTKSLSMIPFSPVTKEMIVERASVAGLGINRNGKVVFLPNIGGFVGSDTVGCIIEGGLMSRSKEYQLLIDLGTNGEIVLFADREKSYACSTAAGPAFEGAKVSCGMQAFAGAINSVWYDEDIKYSTVGNIKPKGICGSGLIDIMAVLIRRGVIEPSGKIVDPEQVKSKKLRQRIIVEGKKKKIKIADIKETYNSNDIFLTQKDIREIQLAKAAIGAGIKILLKTADINYEQVNQILITGAFGNFINKKNALEIGLFLDASPGKIISLGNAAGGGAKLFLCSKLFTDEKLKQYLKNVEHVEISMHPDFQDEFVGNMSF